jgi:hypothetical protein
VWDVFHDVYANPREVLVRHWNWKSAILSSGIRSAIFLTASLPAGWRVASGVVVVEFLFRPLVSGFLGSLTQAFRFAEPAWAASLVVVLLLPAISHVIEFGVHGMNGTPNRMNGIFWSICFSAFSTLLNLYAIRHGVLVVNAPDAAPLRRDLQRIPAIVGGFLAAAPLAIYRRMRTSSKN